MQYISSYNLTLFLFMYFELICSFKFIPFRKDTISLKAIERAPYDDVIPYFSEHVQKSDQILFLGAHTDFSMRLVLDEYGTKKTGFLTIIDENQDKLDELKSMCEKNPEISSHINNNRIKFIRCDYDDMSAVCKQSTFDAIVDYGGIDSILDLSDGDNTKALKCIDHLQNAVRLGNILVCLSKLEKEVFCRPFNERFGWVQELDGDPGEISAWYRGKTNIAASKSNFLSLGLKMYVYTNTDNC